MTWYWTKKIIWLLSLKCRVKCCRWLLAPSVETCARGRSAYRRSTTRSSPTRWTLSSFSHSRQRNRLKGRSVPVTVTVTGVRYNSLLWMCTLNTLTWPDLSWPDLTWPGEHWNSYSIFLVSHPVNQLCTRNQFQQNQYYSERDVALWY